MGGALLCRGDGGTRCRCTLPVDRQLGRSSFYLRCTSAATDISTEVGTEFDWASVSIRESKTPPALDRPPARPLELDRVEVLFLTVRGLPRAVRELAPWGIFLTFVSVVVALVTSMIELDDRNAARTFQAWQVVQSFQNQVPEGTESEDVCDQPLLAPPDRSTAAGTALREALEFLNRDFGGFLCWPAAAGLVSSLLNGNPSRACFIPKKARVSLAGLRARTADLRDANLTRADLWDADLRDADLRRAFLPGTNFTGTDL